jgi:hypothetical protein
VRESVARALAAPEASAADLVEEARELALDRSSFVRAAGLAVLAACARNTLAELAEDAARALSGEEPRGLLGEVARREEVQALAQLPRWPAEAWQRALAVLASPLPAARAAAVEAMSRPSPMPERALAALWSARSDPSALVRAAADAALAQVLAREGALEDDEA